jgi:hypothetical protein
VSLESLEILIALKYIKIDNCTFKYKSFSQLQGEDLPRFHHNQTLPRHYAAQPVVAFIWPSIVRVRIFRSSTTTFASLDTSKHVSMLIGFKRKVLVSEDGALTAMKASEGQEAQRRVCMKQERPSKRAGERKRMARKP